MKETLSVPDLANSFVNEVEDRWVSEQFQHVEQMRKRAELSGTLIAHHEFESADEALAREIDRLTPPRAVKKDNRPRKDPHYRDQTKQDYYMDHDEEGPVD